MESCNRLYRWRQHTTKRTWTLEMYTHYPESEVSRGPYCVQWIPIKARDRKATERKLSEAGIAHIDTLGREL